MMSEPTYYTPTLDEFVEGFEFYIPDTEGNLIKATYTVGDTSVFNAVNEFTGGPFKYSVPDILRVKHLDHADILECGWVISKEQPISIPHKEGTMYELMGKKENWVLWATNIHLNTIWWWNEGASISESKMFQGKIRNKSELKQVMRMVGVKK